MPHVSEEQLIGNYGEAVVAARLAAAGCLVRPVAHGTDFGIDLLCETVAPDSTERGEPFLHFWVQVKTGSKQCIHDAKGYKCRFERHHLAYWRRQPVPVFAALVPAKWPVVQDSCAVHVVDLTELMVNRIRCTTLRATVSWPVDDVDAVSRFLREHVPRVTALLALRSGLVASVPTLPPAYVRSVPVAWASGFRDEILGQIRRTASFSALFMAWQKERDTEFEQHLLAVLSAFQNDKKRKWEFHAAVGYLQSLRNDTVEAVRQYRTAKELIERDGGAGLLSLDEDHWRGTIAWLKEEIEVLGRRPSAT